MRPDLSESHRAAWQWLAAPGSWWTGSQRVAIANEVRSARQCALCAQRKAALSPFSAAQAHESAPDLPDAAVEAVHRVTTDASRLTRAWFERTTAEEVSDGHYAELLGIVVAVVSIDRLHLALGLPVESLPTPEPGAPTGYRPKSATQGDAWLPMLPSKPQKGAEADLYEGLPFLPNVIAAMSLVPDGVRMLMRLSDAHYVEKVQDPRSNGGRALDRRQIELIAGRVSAINECFY
jgi:hypothetical protein